MAIKTIGYIGLGKAGASMASNLPRAGFHLIVHDADPSKSKAFAASNDNVTIASSPEGFENVDVLVTMLPQGKIVRDVLLGSNGIAKFLRPGTIVIDTSSSSPYDTRSLGEELSVLNLSLIDAPVTQSHLHDTSTGAATLMVGSSTSVLDTAMPVLRAMSKYIFHMGPLGTGHAMKTLNNYISASSIVALSDALVTGQKLGLDPLQMIDVLNVGTGKNFSTAESYRLDALTRRYASGFSLALLIKDVRIAGDLFEREGFETKLPGLINGYFTDAMRGLSEGADHTELLKRWEERAGVELRRGEPRGDTYVGGKEGGNGT
jgi:3-hydroxyisobutyrate dehydrogenase